MDGVSRVRGVSGGAVAPGAPVPPKCASVPDAKKCPHLSRLGELLNTLKNVHFFGSRGPGPLRLGVSRGPPLGGPQKGPFLTLPPFHWVYPTNGQNGPFWPFLGQGPYQSVVVGFRKRPKMAFFAVLEKTGPEFNLGPGRAVNAFWASPGGPRGALAGRKNPPGRAGKKNPEISRKFSRARGILERRAPPGPLPDPLFGGPGGARQSWSASPGGCRRSTPTDRGFTGASQGCEASRSALSLAAGLAARDPTWLRTRARSLSRSA